MSQIEKLFFVLHAIQQFIIIRAAAAAAAADVDDADADDADDADADDGDDGFYIAQFSAVGQTHCAFVACDSK